MKTWTLLANLRNQVMMHRHVDCWLNTKMFPKLVTANAKTNFEVSPNDYCSAVSGKTWLCKCRIFYTQQNYLRSTFSCFLKWKSNVTYWTSTEPSIKRCICVNKQKNGEAGASGRGCRNITLTCGRGWIRCRCVRPQKACERQTII